MVIKTSATGSYLDDLKETFDTLTKYLLKLNPNKCTFKVHYGKFLGFMTMERGIEVNSKKNEALMNMVEAWCIKDVQRFNGCIAALERFISKSAERCFLIFSSSEASCKIIHVDNRMYRRMGEVEELFAEHHFWVSRRSAKSYTCINRRVI